MFSLCEESFQPLRRPSKTWKKCLVPRNQEATLMCVVRVSPGFGNKWSRQCFAFFPFVIQLDGTGPAPSQELFSSSLFDEFSISFYKETDQVERALYQKAAKLSYHSFPLTSLAIFDKYLNRLIYKMDIITSFLLRQSTIPDDFLRYIVPFPVNIWFQGNN